MNALTKQALESCCSNMFLVMERRYSDYLHGKYSAAVSDDIYKETRKTSKTNMVGKNDWVLGLGEKQLRVNWSDGSRGEGDVPAKQNCTLAMSASRP